MPYHSYADDMKLLVSIENHSNIDDPIGVVENYVIKVWMQYNIIKLKDDKPLFIIFSTNTSWDKSSVVMQLSRLGLGLEMLVSYLTSLCQCISKIMIRRNSVVIMRVLQLEEKKMHILYTLIL